MPANVRMRSCCEMLLNLPVWLPTDAVNFESDLETNVGVGLQTRGDLDAATGHYRKAIELNPVNADAYRFLGTAYRDQGRQTAARWTGESAYTVDLVVKEMIDRSKELKLRRVSTELRAREDVSVLVAVQATKLLHRVPHPILL